MMETKWKQEIADIIWVYECKKLWNNTSKYKCDDSHIY